MTPDKILFNPEDVWTVAKTVLNFDNAFTSDERGRNAYNVCRYCQQSVYHDKPHSSIQHDYNCPYLVAKDLLTGYE